jgi:hypothetical protein
MADKEAARSGWYLDQTAKATLSKPIPVQAAPMVQQYANDFAAGIIKLRGEIARGINVEQNSALLPLLEAARYQKVMSDPALRQKYMSDYYSQTLEGRKTNADLVGKAYDNIIKQVEAAIALETQSDKKAKLKQEVEKLKQDIENGKLNAQETEARINDIKKQTELRDYTAQTSRISANASATSAETSKERLTTDKGGKTFKDYANRLGELKKEMTSDSAKDAFGNTTTTKRLKYDDQQLLKIIESWDLKAEEKKELAKQYGIF